MQRPRATSIHKLLCWASVSSSQVVMATSVVLGTATTALEMSCSSVPFILYVWRFITPFQALHQRKYKPFHHIAMVSQVPGVTSAGRWKRL